MAIPVVLIVALIVAGLVIGDRNAPIDARVGQTITLHGAPGERGQVTVTRVIDPATPLRGASAPLLGGHYAAVVVRVHNTGTVPITGADTSNGTLNGDLQPAGVPLADCPVLDRDIPPGGTGTDCTRFELLPGQSATSFEMAFNWDGAREGRWKLK